MEGTPARHRTKEVKMATVKKQRKSKKKKIVIIRCLCSQQRLEEIKKERNQIS
jgi:hypothetical protein